MCRVLKANCVAPSVVYCDDFPIVDAEILSEGKQNSDGILIISNGKAFYVASSATDIKTVIEKLEASLTQLASTLTSIGANMTGPTTAPPATLATDIANLNSIKSQLTLLKGALK